MPRRPNGGESDRGAGGGAGGGGSGHRRRRILTGIGATVLVGGGGYVAYGLLGPDGPTDAAKAFVTALFEGDEERAEAMMVVGEGVDSLLLESLSTYDPRRIRGASVRHRSGGRATVDVAIADNRESMVVELEREEGEWLVETYHWSA